MKIDRFVKILLVLIVGLLAMNLVRNDWGSLSRLPLIETSAEASTPPAFIQVGKRYSFSMSGEGVAGVPISAKVLAIDKEGWVQIEDRSWINLKHVMIVK